MDQRAHSLLGDLLNPLSVGRGGLLPHGELQHRRGRRDAVLLVVNGLLLELGVLGEHVHVGRGQGDQVRADEPAHDGVQAPHEKAAEDQEGDAPPGLVQESEVRRDPRSDQFDAQLDAAQEATEAHRIDGQYCRRYGGACHELHNRQDRSLI